MQQIGVGIIGTGSIADGAHAPAVTALPQTALVAVLTREQARGEVFTRRHQAPNATVHTSVESFAADPRINLVIICSPDRLHAEHATACLKAGKHVLLEKPLTVDEASARQLMELAEAKNLQLATGFHLRFHTGHRLLHQKVQAGELGPLRHIRAIWAFPQADDSNWRAHDNLAKWWSLSAVGSHCLDLARWFAADMADWRQFQSVISNEVWRGPHDETAVIAAQLASGVTVEVTSTVQFGPYSRLELFGQKGVAVCQNTLSRSGAGDIQLNDQPLDFTPLNPYEAQLANLVAAITANHPLVTDAAAGLRSVQDLSLVNLSVLK